jgi:four helix bundle protein
MAYRSFEDLEVWKRACQLAVVVCRKLEGWQDLWFREQIASAAVSIASNIAEGSERGGKDFVRFLRIASGSAAELRTQIYIAEGIGKLSPDEATAIVNETKEIAKMITGLSKSIKRKLHPPPPADTP